MFNQRMVSIELYFFCIFLYKSIIVAKNCISYILGEWNQEAYNVVAHVCCGIVGQAQIVGYINTNTYVNLYLNIHKHGVSKSQF